MNTIIKRSTLLLLLILITCGFSNAQDNIKIGADLARGNVRINSVYLKDTGITIYIDNLGRLRDVYSDDTDSYYDPLHSEDTFSFGGVEYYPHNYIFEELSDRLKRIGNLNITYYDRFSWDELRGKIKSIGNINFTYFDRFGWDETKGLIKSIGNVNITYYDRFGRDEDKGKIKSIGSTAFTYSGHMVNIDGYDKNGVLNLRRSVGKYPNLME
ncbi:hypothetical protein LJ707_08565 [Mucilaginibacter sp. UR6-1]|uniref:hypothetical protein n=1 Tax=Mucilaginibacter sp. UR6-1 TaxID=1435643 RepID=UPI001E2B63B1|nr:hypothetical protein [Mucilaginibacter sp. UR6-1]MCC8408981.1 hypothetical protein [Mucilaginibacter sp. UR6-1]